MFTTQLRDPENDIPAGTAFEDLPDDWVCPICGLDKSAFSGYDKERLKMPDV